jgi:hypothetical protein
MLFQQRGGQLTSEQYEGAEQGWRVFFDVIAERLASS